MSSIRFFRSSARISWRKMRDRQSPHDALTQFTPQIQRSHPVAQITSGDCECFDSKRASYGANFALWITVEMWTIEGLRVRTSRLVLNPNRHWWPTSAAIVLPGAEMSSLRTPLHTDPLGQPSNLVETWGIS